MDKFFYKMKCFINERLVADLSILSKIISGPIILNQEFWTGFGGSLEETCGNSLERKGRACDVVLRRVNKWYKPLLSPPVKLIVAMVSSVNIHTHKNKCKTCLIFFIISRRKREVNYRALRIMNGRKYC